MPMFLVALESGSVAEWTLVVNNLRGGFTLCRTTRRAHLTHPIRIPSAARCGSRAKVREGGGHVMTKMTWFFNGVRLPCSRQVAWP